MPQSRIHFIVHIESYRSWCCCVRLVTLPFTTSLLESFLSSRLQCLVARVTVNCIAFLFILPSWLSRSCHLAIFLFLASWHSKLWCIQSSNVPLQSGGCFSVSFLLTLRGGSVLRVNVVRIRRHGKVCKSKCFGAKYVVPCFCVSTLYEKVLESHQDFIFG